MGVVVDSSHLQHAAGILSAPAPVTLQASTIVNSYIQEVVYPTTRFTRNYNRLSSNVMCAIHGVDLMISGFFPYIFALS